ncbi:hypothetical protein EYF80_043593 [Liparis tanakae]|uniref:Uncharacterized protein n=1 Tax=Liparis tanakae TaxID=230148 RepID=A0A4Z2G068_9TELE|nr:hypothetical protein EYF80_043593 [Liparis tanakae]
MIPETPSNNVCNFVYRPFRHQKVTGSSTSLNITPPAVGSSHHQLQRKHTCRYLFIDLLDSSRWRRTRLSPPAEFLNESFPICSPPDLYRGDEKWKEIKRCAEDTEDDLHL